MDRPGLSRLDDAVFGNTRRFRELVLEEHAHGCLLAAAPLATVLWNTSTCVYFGEIVSPYSVVSSGSLYLMEELKIEKQDGVFIN
ncbi:hypothetical protein V1477_011231 [Vespula maculifrons]|uniref:Uncharacterized protein n=1 Tax=Vespula maculifrons TaxID=7453 RepID=A0ABD2C480_VESMC